MSYSVTMGPYYCVRDDSHALVETGEVREDGVRMPDAVLDRTSPAVSVPVHIDGHDGPGL